MFPAPPLSTPNLPITALQINSSYVQYSTSAVLPLAPDLLTQIIKQDTLADALYILVTHAKLQFVLEGIPARLPADKPTIAKLVTDLVALKKPVTTRLLTLALADNYGYSVTEKNDTWIFSKKYENPADFPEVTMAETKYFLRSVLQIVKTYNPEMAREAGFDVQLREFAATLSPEMLARMKTLPRPASGSVNLSSNLAAAEANQNAPKAYDSGGVLITTLAPAHQQFYRLIALKEFIGTDADQISRGLLILQNLDSSKSRFFHMKSGPHTCLTIERKDREKIYETPMTPLSRVGLHFGSALVSNEPLLNGDPDAPKFSDYGPDKKPLPQNEPGKFSLTLDRLMGSVSANSPVALYIVPELAEKTVTILDGRQAAKTDVKATAQMLAELYNITPRASEDGKSITLGLPSRPTVNRLEQIPKAVDMMMPAPLKRLNAGWGSLGYAATQKKFADMAKRFPDIMKSADGKPFQIPDPSVSSKDKIGKGLAVMRKEAIRQLSIRLEPMIAASENHVVMWDDVDAESKWLMQFSLCMEAFPMAYAYTQNGMPDYLSKFESSRAYAEVYQDQGRTWLRVKLLSEDGKSGVTRQGVISKP